MDIITTERAAEMLGCSVARIKQLIPALGLTPQRVGGAYILSASDLAVMRGRNRKPGRPANPATKKVARKARKKKK